MRIILKLCLLIKSCVCFAAAVVVKNFPTTQRSNYLEMLRKKMKEQASFIIECKYW